MEDKLEVTNNTTGEIIPLHISLESDGKDSFVAIKWNMEKRALELVTKNATLDEGAQQFFEDFRDRFGDWIVERIKDKADTCQYCGK